MGQRISDKVNLFVVVALVPGTCKTITFESGVHWPGVLIQQTAALSICPPVKCPPVVDHETADGARLGGGVPAMVLFTGNIPVALNVAVTEPSLFAVYVSMASKVCSLGN